MTIENPEAFAAGFWDWGILDGCFGGKIKPTDIDGFVERKGKFLVLEAKTLGVEIPTGQQITFEALIRLGAFTIFIIWGPTNSPEEIEVWTRNGKRDRRECDLERLRKLTGDWYSYADGGK